MGIFSLLFKQHLSIIVIKNFEIPIPEMTRDDDGDGIH